MNKHHYIKLDDERLTKVFKFNIKELEERVYTFGRIIIQDINDFLGHCDNFNRFTIINMKEGEHIPMHIRGKKIIVKRHKLK